ncbi:PAS domain S-box protein [Gorillibacterium sp. sgz5001074]|uniref:PAS domain S-box protein n=1 Tax=Gorillibacterium sp. sgz5001074 TaxID=3446695 RepID=UPI003F6702E0
MNHFIITHKSLKKQLLQALLILFAIFAAANVAADLWIIHYGSKSQARKTLEENLAIHRNTFEEWLRVNSDFVQSLASLQSFKKQDNPASIQQNLNAVGKLKPYFANLVFINRYGAAQAVTQGEPGKDYSQSRLFAAAKEGKALVIGFEDGAAGMEGSIVFLAPVLEEEQFKGMVAGFVSRETVMQTLSSFRFGATGRMYLMDGQGRVLSDDPAAASGLEQLELFRFARAGLPVSDFYKDRYGEEAWGEAVSVAEGKFQLLAEISRDEVMNPVYRTMLSFAGILMLIFFLCMAALLWYAKRMGITLRLLSESAVAIMNGDYRHVIRLQDGMFRSAETDEILAAFNEMTATVSRQMDELQYMNGQWKDSEERYRTMIESSPDGILIQSEGVIVLINPAGARLLGASSPEELIGKPVISIIHESSLELVKARLRELQLHRSAMAPEARRYVRLDDQVIQVESTAAYISLNGRDAVMVIFRDISDRLHLEATVQQSEELHRFIAENSTDMIARVDMDLTYRYVSQASLHLLGYRNDEMTGRPVLDFVHPDYHSDLLRMTREALESARREESRFYTLRYQFYRKDASLIWLETTARIVRGERGHQYEVVAVSRDITDRMAMERELIESNTRITDILSSITDAFFALDKDWRFTYVNQMAERILGKSQERLIGRVIWEEMPRIIGTRLHEEYHRAVQNQVSLVVEEFYPFLDGWYETRIFPRKEGLSIYVRDITARKKLEEELRVNQEHLSQVLETTPSAIMLINTEGRFTFANRKAEEMYGVPREELTRRFYNDAAWKIYTLEGKPFPSEELPFARVSRTLQPVNGVEVVFEAEDGTRWVHSNNSTPMLDAKGELTSVLVSTTDITQSKRLEQELHKLSTMDGLTGIPNRRHFNEVLVREWHRAARGSKPLSMIMLDVDFFKSYNDTYGHQAGDECLKVTAALLSDEVKRAGDMVFRYGGEEFAVLLPDTDEAGAAVVAEQIRSAVERREIPHRSSPNQVLTASLGIASVIPTPLSGPEALVAKADMALYRAKEHGRNQVQADR